MSFSIIFTFYSRKIKEFGSLKNTWMAFVKLKRNHYILSLHYFKAPHSLEPKIALWYENDDKYFPESQG